MSPKERDRSKDQGRERTPFGASRGQGLLMLDPEEIVIPSDPAHPLFQTGRATEALEEKVIVGMMSVGVLQPVTIRKRDDGRPEIIIGKKRVLHLREANRRLAAKGLDAREIPCVYSKANDNEAVVRMVMENAHRKNLSASQEAEDARKLKVAGYSHEAIGELLGKGLDTIKNLLVLSELHPEAKAAVDENDVRFLDAVRKLGKLPRNEQPAALAKLKKASPTRKGRAEAAKNGSEVAPRVLAPAARVKRLVKFLETDAAALSRKEQVLVSWLLGQEKDSVLVEQFGRLGKFIEGLKA